jgi:TetR/AcrR family transcriptional regulator, transcriptional repressor for nem operon
MSDAATAIMDSAERRMRVGGFNGFSFREIAADVGIKSSSVHYHFPTKEALAAAVVRRYAERVSARIDEDRKSEKNPSKLWTKAFRRSSTSAKTMCPCVVLGAASQDLPAEVSTEVKGFFRMCIEKMTTEGLSRQDATELLSKITGALVLTNALGDSGTYDRATGAGSTGATRKTAPAKKDAASASRRKAFG